MGCFKSLVGFLYIFKRISGTVHAQCRAYAGVRKSHAYIFFLLFKKQKLYFRSVEMYS